MYERLYPETFKTRRPRMKRWDYVSVGGDDFTIIKVKIYLT